MEGFNEAFHAPINKSVDLEVHRVDKESVGKLIEQQLKQYGLGTFEQLSVDMIVEGAPNSHHDHLEGAMRRMTTEIDERSKMLMIFFEDASTPAWSDNQGIQIQVGLRHGKKLISAFVHRPKL